MNRPLRIAFWGLGTIATRHVLNVSQILKQRGKEYIIDAYRHSSKGINNSELEEIISNVYREDQLESNNVVYDILFITNPTSMHFETIKRCVPYAGNMFIEKPVFEFCDEKIEDLGLRDDAVYYVACPLRYTAVLQYIKDNVDFDKVYSVRAISSSYLPDWRPGIDYRNTYSAHKDLGGGVAIDLIHEWDYLTSFFGMPNKSIYVGGTFSELEIDSDDLATYLGIYDDKIVELHLDYFGRETIRECVFFMKEDTIVADLVNSKVKYLKSSRVIELYEKRNDYQVKELEHFLDIIDGKVTNDNTIQHAIGVLKIARDYKGE